MYDHITAEGVWYSLLRTASRLSPSRRALFLMSEVPLYGPYGIAYRRFFWIIPCTEIDTRLWWWVQIAMGVWRWVPMKRA